MVLFLFQSVISVSKVSFVVKERKILPPNQCNEKSLTWAPGSPSSPGSPLPPCSPYKVVIRNAMKHIDTYIVPCYITCVSWHLTCFSENEIGCPLILFSSSTPRVLIHLGFQLATSLRLLFKTVLLLPTMLTRSTKKRIEITCQLMKATQQVASVSPLYMTL